MTTSRVLHVVGAMNRGGAETLLMTLYRAIDRGRLQFDFLEMRPGRSHYADEIEAMGGRILKCSWSQSPNAVLATIRHVARIIELNGPYLAVHSHILFASGTALLAARKAGVKIRIAHSHNTADQSTGLRAAIYRGAARAMIRGCATQIAACTADAGSYLFGANRFAAAGSLIPNSVDLMQFYPGRADERNESRTSLGGSRTRVLLVSVARLEPVKNHRFLIRVADELRDRGVGFDLLFIGDGSQDRPLRDEVAARSLEDCVRFLGVRDDVARILRGADALLMPSHFEGLPVALVEAQASGLPCVVSTSVSREADFGLGIVLFRDIDDPADWVDAILMVADCPRIDWVEARGALERRGYEIGSSVERLLALYSLGRGVA